MKKGVLFTLIVMLFAVTGQAQSITKAKEILGNVSKKYKSYNSLQADFKFTLEFQSENFKEEQKGSLFMKKATNNLNMFKVDLGETVIYCDGKTMWTHMKDANEVQVNNYDAKALGFNPSELFTIYEKGYSYLYMGDETLNGKTVHLIELTPEDKKQSTFKVKLYIEKGSNNIILSKVLEKNGDIYTYEILNFIPNPQLADGFFTFEKIKHPKVVVSDLR